MHNRKKYQYSIEYYLYKYKELGIHGLKYV